MKARRTQQPSGFAAFEKRVADLVRQCAAIPPGDIMKLLMRADADPGLDVHKAFAALRRKYSSRRG